MSAHKPLRSKGKISFSSYFQKFNKGDFVALVVNAGLKTPFPPRMRGRTGVVSAKRGFSYVVDVNDLGMAKQVVVPALFLKRVMGAKA